MHIATTSRSRRITLTNTSLISPTAHTLRVVICDDQAPYRFFLRSLLEQERDIEVVGEGWHGGQAIEQCRDLRPDVLVIDLDMPVMDGYTAMSRVRQITPDVRICVLTGTDPESVVAAALEAGAALVFGKQTPPAQIIAAVRDLASVSATR